MKDIVKREFIARFGHGETMLYASPGRINLIGEHTDYNGGFVLPGAIDKRMYLAIRPVQGQTSRVVSLDFGQQVDIVQGGAPPEQHWAKYIYGVLAEIEKFGRRSGAFDCVVGGDVPLGAGLSSSAALESVFGFALNDIFALGLRSIDIARIGQLTEHNWAGVRCGIMDQYASVFGSPDNVLCLDCRQLTHRLIPFKPEGCRIVLIDTMVKHSLASTQYNVRRQQCEAGVAAVAGRGNDVESLRDVTLEMLDRNRPYMDQTVYRRCRYVIEENDRVQQGCADLERGDYRAFGRRMYASHDGLSRQYEVSCPELDFIVDVARGHEGVLGARMMGGGFGGCVIALVDNDAEARFLQDVADRYQSRFSKQPRVMEVAIGAGASKLM